MKEATDVLKVVGIVLLALFVLAVGVPLVLTAAGVALGILGFLVGLAVTHQVGRGCGHYLLDHCWHSRCFEVKRYAAIST